MKTMNKKAVSTMVVATLMAMTITPAMAVENSTTVNYSVASDYQVVIPESAVLGDSMTITAVLMNLDYDEAVSVKVSDGVSNGVVTLVREGDKTTEITADVTKNGKKIIDPESAVVAQFKSDSTTAVDGTGELNLSKPKEAYVKAGNYSGTLIFSIKLEKGSNISSTEAGWEMN